MTGLLVRLLLALGFVMSAGAVAQAEKAGASSLRWPSQWRSEELRDHPLAGKIYDTRAKRFVTPEDYFAALPKTMNLLLGEVHDNPDHHRLQALAIARVKPEAVVFEHFRSDQQVVIDAFQVGLKTSGATVDDPADRLFLVTQWDKSGWPEKRIYRPLVEAVLASGAKIIAGNVPRRRVIEVARDGFVALSEHARRAMWLDRPLGSHGGEDLDDALLEELEASHCGLMPKSAFGNMAVAQRLRDAQMATAMLLARVERPVVLVAGNGHVRRDRGVPWYLAQRYAAVRLTVPGSLSVGHMEVAEGRNRPEDYAEAVEVYSFIVFTPRAKRDDPCDAMRKRYGKNKKK